MRRNIVFEDGRITLGGAEVPGILQDLRVACRVRFDEHKSDNLSGKSKIPTGYEDADISVTVALLTDDNSDCYEKAAELAGLFKDTDGKLNPQIFTVVNKHIQARGVKQVVFSSLDTTESSRNDEIRATLKFVEHMPPIVRPEKAEAKTPSADEVAKSNAAKTAPKPEDSLLINGG